MSYRLRIQHFVQSALFGSRKSEGFLPDLIIFHAKVNAGLRRELADCGNNFLIDCNSQRLKIAHLAVNACDKFTIDNL